MLFMFHQLKFCGFVHTTYPSWLDSYNPQSVREGVNLCTSKMNIRNNKEESSLLTVHILCPATFAPWRIHTPPLTTMLVHPSVEHIFLADFFLSLSGSSRTKLLLEVSKVDFGAVTGMVLLFAAATLGFANLLDKINAPNLSSESSSSEQMWQTFSAL